MIFIPMFDSINPHRALPLPADRRKIIEKARRILTAAQAIIKHSDRCFARPSAARTDECAKALPAHRCGIGAATDDLASIELKSL